MKRGFFLLLLMVALGLNAAFAGVVDKIEGEWSGSFVAIYNTGEILALDNGIATIIQDDNYPNLFYGTMEFEIEPDVFITSYLTGYIGEDKRISILLTPPQEYNFEDVVPIPATGIIEARLTGNTIKGVVRDFTDTTTTMFIATRGGEPMETGATLQNRNRIKSRNK